MKHAGIRGASRFPVFFLLTILGFTAAHGGEPDRFREIYPIPRQALYRDEVFPAGKGLSILPGAGFMRERLSLFAADFSRYLEKRHSQPCDLTVGDAPGRLPVRLVTPERLSPEQRQRLAKENLDPARWPEGERGRQSYLLSVRGSDVLLAASGEQGAAYGLAALVQLLRWEDGGWTVRGAEVLDYPGFEFRMGVAADVGGRDAPAERQEEALLLESLFLRHTHGKDGYPGDTSRQSYARDRFLRLTAGYWNRPEPKAPLSPFNWSDPGVNAEYVRLMREYAAIPGIGAYFWHDATDAGWWSVYIDRFWNRRDAADRAAYPGDPSPLRPDAARFRMMFDAFSRHHPDLDMVWTIPVYYDEPQKDGLKDIANFRAYLEAMGRTVPGGMRDRFFVMLEERDPEAFAAYRRYLGGLKLCQYRYTSAWEGDTWDLKFTEAKRHDGRIEGYFYEGIDLLGLMAAQYFWNPDLPTDENYLAEQLAPRAAYQLYGPAWKEMVEWHRLNLNLKTIARESNSRILTARRDVAEQAMAHLAKAREAIPAAWTYARFRVARREAHTTKYRDHVLAGLEKASRIVPLDGAAFTSNRPGGKPLRDAALSDGLAAWSSGETEGPHYIEVKLPGVYSMNRVQLKAPDYEGYAWRDAELQAEVFGHWKTLTPLKGHQVITGEFDDVRTDRIRIVFRLGGDWSKADRKDLLFSGLRLFGAEATPDPENVARLDGQWHFRLDPGRAGMANGWPTLRTFPPGEWHRIAVPSRFEASGLPGTANYDGQVWYALTFPTPGGWPGKVIQLHFEAVDDEAEVWLNGHRLGLHTREGEADTAWWEEPFAFDATRALRETGDNVLVVRVDDFALDGGIWKSVFLKIADGPGLYSPTK